MKEEPEIRKIGPYTYELRTPELEAAEQKAKQLIDILQTDQFLLTVDQLIEEIKTSPLAKRFPEDKPIRAFLEIPLGEGTMESRQHPGETKGISHAAKKRRSLVAKLEKIKGDVKNLAGEAYDAVLNFEASKID